MVCASGASLARPESEATPLLRYLFAAAVQPVLQSLRSWALMPDIAAAEAAAEATAMASFNAGSSTPGSSLAAVTAAPMHTTVDGSGGPFAAVGGQQLAWEAGWAADTVWLDDKSYFSVHLLKVRA